MKFFTKKRWGLGLLTVLSFTILAGGVSFAVGGSNYTLFYPENDESQTKIKNEITDSGIGEGSGGLEQTKIYSQGGPFGTIMFNFDRSESNKRDKLVYSRVVYCSIPGSATDYTKGQFSLEAPKGVSYVQFVMGVSMPPGVGGELFNKSSYTLYSGVLDKGTHEVTLYKAGVTSPTNGAPDQPSKTKAVGLDVKDRFWGGTHSVLQGGKGYDDTGYFNGTNYGIPKEDLKKKITNQCLRHLVDKGQPGGITNFQKLPDAQKGNWLTALSTAGLGDPEDTAADAAAGADADDGSVGVNCQGGPMGWLFCPMINYMTDALQTIARLIDSLMQVKFLAQAGSSNSIETAWRAFLSIANIMLVIAFMVIVFSQSTGAGLNNYNIKRMLPRLVIAAVLMNVSFYICALAIDISNIVGASVMGLFIGGDSSVGGAITEATGGAGGKGILGGALTGALLIGLLLFILTPVILSIIVVFITLIARQLILICLILASPIAFVAWLLPNTEQYFKKWYSLFFQMLILYPAVMFIFGASLFFAKFLGGGGQGIDRPDFGPDYEILRQITQLIVLCIPLVALPLLIKGSSNIMGKIGGYADKAGLKGISGAKGAGKLARKAPGVRAPFEAAGQWKDARGAAADKRRSERRINRAGRLGIIPGKDTRAILRASAGAGKEEMENKRVKEEMAGIEYGKGTGGKEYKRMDHHEQVAHLARMVGDKSATDYQRRAAASMLVKKGKDGMEQLQTFAMGPEERDGDGYAAVTRHLMDDHYGDIEKLAPEILGQMTAGAGATPDAGSWGKVTGANAQDLTDTSFQAGIASGGISERTLRDIRDTPEVWARMNDAKKEAITARVGDGGPLPQPTQHGGGGGGTPLPQPTQHGGGGPAAPPADIPAGYEKSDNSEIIIPRQR